MTNTQSKNITVIQFARLVDRPAQQIYQMHRNGTIPSEIVTYIPKSDGRGKQPLLNQEAALEWWNARQQKRQKGTVKVVTDANQVLLRMQEMLNESKDPEVKKLAKVMNKVMAAMEKKQ